MKNSFCGFLFVILSFFLFSSAFAKDNPKGISLTKVSDGYNVTFHLPDYYMNNITAEGSNYINLNIPEYGVTPDVGLPQLPHITFSIMVAYDENNATFKVIDRITDNKILKDKIYPAQQPWPKNIPLDERPFTINRAYYESKGNIDGPFVKISESFAMAGIKGLTITVYPFAYNPSSNELAVTKSGSFKIQLSKEPFSRINPAESFDKVFNGLFLNYQSNKTLVAGRYLIITAPEYQTTLNPFINHKTSLGYNVIIVSTATTGTTNTAIKTYIQQQYNNVSTRPEFILLVGDVDKIPEWIGTGEGTPHTDLNYSLLEGTDPYADVFLGRMSVTNTTQLTNVINKTIYMENNISSLLKKNVFMASNDNYTISEGTHNFVIDSFFVNSVYANTLLYSHSGATTAQLIAALNANQNFAIYSGHGAETYWADGPVLYQADINALTNTVFPYVYSFACVTGSYHLSSECFGETWIRANNGGSCFWGSSVNSYWDEDDILERRIARAMFTEHLIKTSPSFVLGKVLLVQNFGSVTPTMQRYLEMYNLMGDPSVYQFEYGPTISHTALPNTENLAGPYAVNCVINPSGSSIDPSRTKIFWTRSISFTDSSLMNNTSGNNWSVSITGNNSPATYRYYIQAYDMMNRKVTSPGGAPTNFYTFIANADTVRPVIIHTAIPSTPKQNWPVTVMANVTDNIGIDSVFVRWYKNTPSTVKTFRLNNTSGSTYSSAFNSLNSEVTPGDIIYYRIIARDNSSHHNADSTSLYQFNITNLVTNTIVRNVWIPIRDNVTSYDSIQVSTARGTIIDVNFLMNNLIHTYDGDVSFYIRSPQGTEVTLSSAHGSSGVNYIQTVFDDDAATPIANGTPPFTGNFKPDSPLNVFIGQTSNGWWRFKVVDNAGADTGSVRQYTLIIQTTELLTNINIDNNIPKEYTLNQNYPNPFNPVTKINFGLPKQGLVTLKIYDILGREVKTLVNEIKAPGSYSIDFNASELSSGVYFYRLVSNDFTSIKRMILIK